MNKLSKLLLFVVVLVTVSHVVGQTPDREQRPGLPSAAITIRDFDQGILEGRTYSNNFFGLSVSLPRDWIIADAQGRDSIVSESKNRISSDDKEKKELVEASIARSVNLLSVTKLPVGQAHNASLMLIAERIPSPSIKNGVDVIHSMEETTKNTNFTLEFQGPIQTEQIGTAEFAIATMKNSSPYGVLMQKVYMTVKNGYALEFFFTYTDATDLTTFDTVVKTMQMK
jgi:hypothetical protein